MHTEPAALDYRIPHISLKSNRQNSPHMLLEKKLNDCGELGLNGDLTQSVFYELAWPPKTTSPHR